MPLKQNKGWGKEPTKETSLGKEQANPYRGHL